MYPNPQEALPLPSRPKCLDSRAGRSSRRTSNHSSVRIRSVTPDLLEWDKVQADPKMLAALTGKPGKQ
jgi:hypothetical protein